MSEESIDFTVDGTPASFATSGELPWREAVCDAARAAFGERPPIPGRLCVEIDFVMPTRPVSHPGWDLDNLVKPTVDALTPVIGRRPGRWRHEQANDERIDELRATKRVAGAAEAPGARIRCAVITPASAP